MKIKYNPNYIPINTHQYHQHSGSRVVKRQNDTLQSSQAGQAGSQSQSGQVGSRVKTRTQIVNKARKNKVREEKNPQTAEPYRVEYDYEA